MAHAHLEEYAKVFYEITNSYRKKGYKDWGREGEMRKAIHGIEESQAVYDTTLLLTLRKHEKDFLLRKDLLYVKKFDSSIEKFKNSLLSAGAKGDVLSKVDTYGNEFHQIVEAEKLLGFTDEEGLKGRLRNIIHKIEALTETLGQTISLRVQSVQNTSYWYLISLFVIQLMIGIWLSISFSNATTTSIQAIQGRIEKLLKGIPDKIMVHAHDEIAETSHSLNNLIDRIRTAGEFANKIGEGELNIEYDRNFNNGVLALSLQVMHQKLKEAADDNQKRGWVNTGLANFADILRNPGLSLPDLCQRLVSVLVKYLNANQAQLYMVQESSTGESLQLMATYAWGRNKFLDHTIHKGAGLAGQAWFEGETICLSEIPDGYVKITSGLGEANPNYILIVPLKINDAVSGVLEIAAFKSLAQYQVVFVEKLVEMIAAALFNIKTNMLTKTLLEESRHQADELRAQEEEMRQNQEEMQATQEELSRHRQELEEEIIRLEKELKQYKTASKNKG